MAKKRNGFDWLSNNLLPIGLAVLGFVVGYTKLQASVSQAGEKQVEANKRVDKIEEQQNNLYANSVEIKVQQAQIGQKLDNLLDYIKESKEDRKK